MLKCPTELGGIVSKLSICWAFSAGRVRCSLQGWAGVSVHTDHTHHLLYMTTFMIDTLYRTKEVHIPSFSCPYNHSETSPCSISLSSFMYYSSNWLWVAFIWCKLWLQCVRLLDLFNFPVTYVCIFPENYDTFLNFTMTQVVKQKGFYTDVTRGQLSRAALSPVTVTLQSGAAPPSLIVRTELHRGTESAPETHLSSVQLHSHVTFSSNKSIHQSNGDPICLFPAVFFYPCSLHK